MNVRGGWQRRPGPAALLALAAAILVLAVTASSWIRPLGYSDDHLRELASRRYGNQIARYYQTVRQGTTVRPLRLALTPLVDLEVTVKPLAAESPRPVGLPDSASVGEQALPPGRYSLRTAVRWELLGALALGLLVLAQVGLYVYRHISSVNPRPSMPAEPQLVQPATIPGGVAPAPPPLVHPVEQVFRDDIARLQARADELDVHSGLYLSAGLAVAVIGLLIFVLAPRPAAPEGTTAAVLAALQPTAILIFAEAVAFFLLRQHKVMIASHGHFDALILKRNSWVAALRLLEGGASADPVRAALVTALVGEDVPAPMAELGGDDDDADGGDRAGSALAELLARAAANITEKK
ncbi:MAG TPA: hypothetical protein VF006_02055 [Longimicrobium sp.]